MKNNFSILVFTLLSLLYGCQNQFEQQAIGDYKIESYEKIDSSNTSLIDFPQLKLNKNKTLLIAYKSKLLKGNWEAGDNGDRTWIEFYFNGISSDADMGNGLINIWNPSDFFCPFKKRFTDCN